MALTDGGVGSWASLGWVLHKKIREFYGTDQTCQFLANKETRVQCRKPRTQPSCYAEQTLEGNGRGVKGVWFSGPAVLKD